MLRSIHFVAVALFVGNVISTLIWKIKAEMTRDPKIIVYSLKSAIYADKAITLPSAICLTVSGVLLMWEQGLKLGDHGWLQILIAFWAVSAFVAITYLIPSLSLLLRLAE